MIPSAAELSILIGVGGRGKPNSWIVIYSGTDVWSFWKSPPTFALAAEATICHSNLYYVWIGPIAGGGRFRDVLGLAR